MNIAYMVSRFESWRSPRRLWRNGKRKCFRNTLKVKAIIACAGSFRYKGARCCKFLTRIDYQYYPLKVAGSIPAWPSKQYQMGQ